MKGLLFTYALTYGGAVVSLFNPWYGVLIYIAFAILRPDSLWQYSLPAGNYSFTIALAFLAGWALHGFGTWNVGRAKPVLLCLLFFWFWLALQIPLSPEPEATLTAVQELSKTYLPFVVGLTLLDSVQKLKQLAWTLVLAQGYVAYEFNQLYLNYPAFNPNEWRFGGNDNNGIAILMSTTTGAAFFLGLGASRWWQKLICFISAGLMVHTILFSMSRGGMLALVLTGVVSFFLVPKRPKHYALFAVGVAVTLRLAGPAVVKEFSTVFVDKDVRDTSAESRVELSKACLQEMVENPLTGVGLDRWPVVVTKYGFPVGKEAHNTWLQLGAELGVPGLLALLGFYAIGVLLLWPLSRTKVVATDPIVVDVARMVVASITGFFVSATFVTVEGLEIPYYTMLLGAGALRLVGTSAVAHQTPFMDAAIPGAWGRPYGSHPSSMAPIAQYRPAQ